MNLKSILTLIITVALTFAFCYTVIKFLDDDMAKTIVSAFITVATSVIGYYIGYQANKSDK